MCRGRPLDHRCQLPANTRPFVPKIVPKASQKQCRILCSDMRVLHTWFGRGVSNPKIRQLGQRSSCCFGVFLIVVHFLTGIKTVAKLVDETTTFRAAGRVTRFVGWTTRLVFKFDTQGIVAIFWRTDPNANFAVTIGTNPNGQKTHCCRLHNGLIQTTDGLPQGPAFYNILQFQSRASSVFF